MFIVYPIYTLESHVCLKCLCREFRDDLMRWMPPPTTSCVPCRFVWTQFREHIDHDQDRPLGDRLGDGQFSGFGGRAE